MSRAAHSWWSTMRHWREAANGRLGLERVQGYSAQLTFIQRGKQDVQPIDQPTAAEVDQHRARFQQP